MAFGSLFPGRARSQREKRVRELAQALNARDYEQVGEFLTANVLVFNVRGGRTEGRAAFIRKDRAFREASRAIVQLDEIIHHDDEVLVRGRLESPLPDVGGPTMWRVGFEGELISQVEITRVNDG